MSARERPTSSLAATTRQIGYWVDRGWLAPSSRGTGFSYRWTDGEWRVASVMARLVSAGLSPEVAHRVARAGGVEEIAAGVIVMVDRLGGPS